MKICCILQSEVYSQVGHRAPFLRQCNHTTKFDRIKKLMPHSNVPNVVSQITARNVIQDV